MLIVLIEKVDSNLEDLILFTHVYPMGFCKRNVQDENLYVLETLFIKTTYRTFSD